MERTHAVLDASQFVYSTHVKASHPPSKFEPHGGPPSIRIERATSEAAREGYRSPGVRDNRNVRLVVRGLSTPTLVYRYFIFSLAFGLFVLLPALSIGFNTVVSLLCLVLGLTVFGQFAFAPYRRWKRLIEITIHDGNLVIREGASVRSIPLPSLHRIYCTKTVHKTEPPTHNVMGVRGDDHLLLIDSLASADEAHFIGRAIEHPLPIESESDAGVHARGNLPE